MKDSEIIGNSRIKTNARSHGRKKEKEEGPPVNMRLNEFLMDIDEEEVSAAYARMFFDIEGEHSLREAKSVCKVLLHGIQDALAVRQEKATTPTASKRFVFPIIIDEQPELDIDDPIVDIAMMRYSSVSKIPEYLKNHPACIEYSDVSGSEDIRKVVYEPNVVSYPVLLTSLDELKDCSIYIPSGHDSYKHLAAAGIIYGLSLFGSDIEECEKMKTEVSADIKETARKNGYSCDNADEILQAVAPSMSPEDYDDELLDKMMTARYNARIEMYDRIYCDMMTHIS